MKKFVYKDKAVLYCEDDFVVPASWEEKHLSAKEKKKVPVLVDGYVVVRLDK